MPILKGIGAIPKEKGEKTILNATSRIIIRTFIFFLLFFILILFAFSAGWIKITIEPTKVLNDIGTTIEEAKKSGEIGLIESLNIDSDQNISLIKHTIQPGETLLDLEKKYGTNWKVIQRINKIDDALKLKPGTIIYVPVRLSDS